MKNNKKVYAYIAVKESVQNGHKIYSDEVMELKKITANDTSAAGGEAVKQTSTSSSNIHQDNSDVKKKQPKERTQEEKLKTFKDTKRKELKNALSKFKNKDFKNEETGIIARISSTGIDKMGSDKAIEKSVNNGFSVSNHFEIANKVIDLYKKAHLVHIGRDEKHNPPDTNIKSIKRFIATTELNNGTKVDALITVKESVVDGHRLYSIELDKINKASHRWQADKTANSKQSSKDDHEKPNSNIHQDNSDVKKKQPKERTQEGYENYYKKKLFSSLTDEEKKQKKENIESSVVSEIKKDSVPYDNSGVYDKAGKAWLKANPQKDAITPIGEIIINEKSVLRDMHHGEPADKYLKLQTLPAVKDVLEKGTYLGYEDDFDGKPIDNHYFAGKIKYGDKEKIVFCRVRENAGGEGRFYVHEVFTEDEIKRDFLAPIDGSLPRLTGKPLYKFILQDVLNVKKKQERRAKVVKSHGYDDLPEDLKNEDTKKLFEYMDSHPSNNADIDFLYSNLGGILPKNVTIYADTKRGHYIPSEKSVRINPIKDAIAEKRRKIPLFLSACNLPGFAFCAACGGEKNGLTLSRSVYSMKT